VRKRVRRERPDDVDETTVPRRGFHAFGKKSRKNRPKGPSSEAFPGGNVPMLYGSAARGTRGMMWMSSDNSTRGGVETRKKTPRGRAGGL